MKSKRDYGLPPLTFEEAARVLDVDVGALMNWVMATMRPSTTEWSMWTNRRRDLPETVIRLYLVEGRPQESAYHRELREVKQQIAKLAEALAQALAAPQKALPAAKKKVLG